MKRIFDIFCSGIGLVVLGPMIMVVAVMVRRKLGNPVLFRQIRPGLHGKPFEMLKFRTMRDAYDNSGNPLPDEQRITKFGSFLRSTSIDELPELFNVLKGDMSLVGPRPLLMEYLPYYTEREEIRHTVRPGITGLAQIVGRNNLLWDKRLEIDVQYAETHTLLLDLKILFKTIFKVINRSDVVVIPSKLYGKLSIERAMRHKIDS